MKRNSLLLNQPILVVLLLLLADAESQRCERGFYPCDGGCVSPCDGLPECKDGADETTVLCSNFQCSSTFNQDLGIFGGVLNGASSIAGRKFQCDYGGCIVDNFKCNGRPHCWDESDETLDLCKSKICKRLEVKCDYGGCIRRIWECDGKIDCRDGSDETAAKCSSKTCPSSKPFRCDYGACIANKYKCDGEAHCHDNSDESEELCGAGHNFTRRASDFVQIPEAETNPVLITPPPAKPPATTKPTTEPPPTNPPPPFATTNPSTPDPCEASSMCTCPVHGICVPCERLSECPTLLDGPKCSLPSNETENGITADILACGQETVVNVAVFSRNFNALCSSTEVPVNTVVAADCWGTATILAECREDSLWHPYGNHLDEHSMESSKDLCQPKSVNSLICGRRPRYRRPVNQFVNTNPQQQWPWLASIFRNFTYSCTATVINKDYLLTAAHCVTTSEESVIPVNIESLIVHYRGENGGVRSSFVTGVHLYPGYKGGSRPSNDIALLKIKDQVDFSQKAVPACVSTQGFPEENIAATFDRKHPNVSIWETLLQKKDERCQIDLDRCLTRTIEPDQFCAIDINGNRFLPKGASGGPYLVNMGNDVEEQWTVAGIVSAASGDEFSCRKPFTIFTKVSDFWPWIDRCANRQICS